MYPDVLLIISKCEEYVSPHITPVVLRANVSLGGFVNPRNTKLMFYSKRNLAAFAKNQVVNPSASL